MYKGLAVGCAIGFGIGLILASTLFETWLAPFGNPLEHIANGNVALWDWVSQTNFWKFMGIIWIITGLVGVYFVYKGTEKTKPPPETMKTIPKNYMEITEEPAHEGSDRTTVTMASIEDLRKVANTLAKPILHRKLPSQTAEREASHGFYVLNGSIRYEFIKAQSPKTPPSMPTTVSSMKPPTTPTQKKHLTIKHKYILALGSIASCIILLVIYFAGFLPWQPPTIPIINLTLPALPTTLPKELVIVLVVSGITAVIGFMSIIFRRMKRK